MSLLEVPLPMLRAATRQARRVEPDVPVSDVIAFAMVCRLTMHDRGSIMALRGIKARVGF